MSSFIAQSIRFNQDFTAFELFGDDNNVFPKFNRWTREIPVTELLRELAGGTTKLNRAKYPSIHKAANEAAKEFAKRFGECDWDTNKKSIWHWPYMARENQVNEEDKIFFAQLEQKFISSVKNIKRTPNDQQGAGTAAPCLF